MNTVRKEVLPVACRKMFKFMRYNTSHYKAHELIVELGMKEIKTSSHIRCVVHELRMKGIPVCSAGDGYWLGQSDEEIQTCGGRLTSRAINIWNAARNMMRVLYGQMTMEQIIDEAFPLGKEDADVR